MLFRLARTFRAIAREPFFSSSSRKASIAGVDSRANFTFPISGLMCSFAWLPYWRSVERSSFSSSPRLDPQLGSLGDGNAGVLGCVHTAGDFALCRYEPGGRRLLRLERFDMALAGL